MEELFKNASTMYADWIKNLAALSIAALTILVSMMPETAPTAPANYFLAACWILLALCIPCSLAASFRPIVESKKLAHAAIDLMQPPRKDGKIEGSEYSKKLHKQNLLLLKFELVAIASFCLSFVSLAIYACISIL